MYLRGFCEQLSADSLSESYIEDVAMSDHLNLDEKVLIIDSLLGHFPDSKALCEDMSKKPLDDDLVRYFCSKLLYYNLDDLELCRDMLRTMSIEIYDDVFMFPGTNYYVAQVYNKYKCFYHWRKNDIWKAVNSLHAYQLAKYKPLQFQSRTSDDERLILREFKDDEEFNRIK